MRTLFELRPVALSFLFFLLTLTQNVTASVTVYGQTGVISQVQTDGSAPTSTSSANTAFYTGLAAYNTTILTAPALPNPLPATQFQVQLQGSSQDVNGLSIAQNGAFLGFSIEMSVVTQVSQCPLLSCTSVSAHAETSHFS